MKYLLGSFLILFASGVSAQCAGFDNQLRKGDNYLTRSKPNYEEAINAYTAAIIACPERADEAKQRISQMVTGINKLKTDAIEAEKNAKKERDNAVKSEQNAKNARDSAVLAQKAAYEALEKQKIALAALVRFHLKNADTLIYRLDYEGACEKIKSTIALGVLEKEISDALLELAFWYAETNRLDRARGLLDTAYTLAGRKLEAPTGDRDAARAAIRALNPARDSFLQARYFPVMLDIPGGTNTIGGIIIDVFWGSDTIPPFIITVSPFQMAESETTWWQYNLFCAAFGYEEPDKPLRWDKVGNHPVINVRYYDAVAYSNWLSERAGLDKAITIDFDSDKDYAVDTKTLGYRLPTESEWEYAARAGTNLTYAGCDSTNELGDFAWYDENSKHQTHPVKGKKPNGWGLYDMSGNVWEWCWDWYASYPPNPETDYQGPADGEYCVVRGGAWDNGPDDCRAASRFNREPGIRDNDLGFRVVRHKK